MYALFSRLLGLTCALVPGLLFLAFSVRFVKSWPELGYVTGPFYSLLSLITGAICLYLGVTILFGRDQPDEPTTSVTAAPLTPLATEPTEPIEPPTLRAAPLPAEAPPLEVSSVEAPPASVETLAPAAPSIFGKASDAPALPPDTPEMRIRRLAATRPQWQVTAAQLAQLTNLNMAIADATAREMASRGQAQIQTGPHGETVYLFDLAEANN